MNEVVRILCWLALALCTVSASARDLSKEEIVCGLDPACAKPRTHAMPRGVTVTPGAAEATSPSVDLYVDFAYDSVNTRPTRASPSTGSALRCATGASRALRS